MVYVFTIGIRNGLKKQKLDKTWMKKSWVIWNTTNISLLNNYFKFYVIEYSQPSTITFGHSIKALLLSTNNEWILHVKNLYEIIVTLQVDLKVDHYLYNFMLCYITSIVLYHIEIASEKRGIVMKWVELYIVYDIVHEFSNPFVDNIEKIVITLQFPRYIPLMSRY